MKGQNEIEFSDRAKCVWERWEEVYKVVDKSINVIVINVGNGRR